MLTNVIGCSKESRFRAAINATRKQLTEAGFNPIDGKIYEKREGEDTYRAEVHVSDFYHYVTFSRFRAEKKVCHSCGKPSEHFSSMYGGSLRNEYGFDARTYDIVCPECEKDYEN